MPSLARVLVDYDLGLLRLMAELWGVELSAATQLEAARELAEQLAQPELVEEVVQALPVETRTALDTLRCDGRVLLAQFARQHGELRAMGAARREREQPWRNAPSVTETLWYRGLIAHAFFDEGELGPQEFAFIPDDFLPLLHPGVSAPPAAAVPGASGSAPSAWQSTAGLAADDVATLLAYLQIASVKLEGTALLPRHRQSVSRFLRLPDALDLWMHLILRLDLAGGAPLKPEPMQARPFLEAAHSEQMRQLAQAWRASREWNELFHLPGLTFEGQGWRNDPWAARQAILNFLAEVPPGEWWSLETFVAAVKERRPDFQRPAGDYDAWYIRDAATHTYLRGFENWDRVDGALIRWLIQKPMYWLGLTEIGADVFRLTPPGAAFLEKAAWPPAEESQPLQVSADGALRVPAAASRYDRFQAARVCNWLPLEGNHYLYRLAPASLARAAKQGIKVSHILAFLQKSSGTEALPPSLVGALHRWERAGQEAALKDTVVLKLKSPDLLETLQRTPGVKRYLGERLGPTAVEVRREELAHLRAALAELGILTD